MFVTIILLLVKAENREKSYSKNFSAVSQDAASIHGVLCMWTELFAALGLCRNFILEMKMATALLLGAKVDYTIILKIVKFAEKKSMFRGKLFVF